MLDIFLFILGAAFVILSFFIGDDKKKTETTEIREFEFPAEKLEEAEKKVNDTISLTSENVIVDTENKLSAISNETIMFVDDFSKQTLERIQHNHEEVVFMYNMLQNKEEELKKTLSEMDSQKSEIEKQKKELEAMMVPKVPEESGIEMARKKSAAEKQVAEKPAAPVRKAVKAPVVKEEPVKIELPAVEEVEFSDSDEESKTKKILDLYKQRKSVLEISKQLGLGQGEVKLVIDLYGRQ